MSTHLWWNSDRIMGWSCARIISTSLQLQLGQAPEVHRVQIQWRKLRYITDSMVWLFIILFKPSSSEVLIWEFTPMSQCVHCIFWICAARYICACWYSIRIYVVNSSLYCALSQQWQFLIITALVSLEMTSVILFDTAVILPSSPSGVNQYYNIVTTIISMVTSPECVHMLTSNLTLIMWDVWCRKCSQLWQSQRHLVSFRLMNYIWWSLRINYLAYVIYLHK